MDQKKTEFSDDSPTEDQLQSTEDVSASEEFEMSGGGGGDTMMEETVVTKSEEIETGEEAAIGNEITPVKKGRGRPKGPKRTPPPVDGSVPKKGRGRPRKIPGITNGTPKRKSKSPSVYIETFDEEGYPQQKRRGRPPKQPQVVMTTEDNYGTYEVDYAEWYADDGIVEEPVSRKRGRPKKFEASEPKATKKRKKSIPKILLKGYDSQFYPQKGRGRPKSRSDSNSKHAARLGSEVDRLANMLDRLESKSFSQINIDGLINEETDLDTEQEMDKQIFIIQRNFNVKLDLKTDFKGIVRGYLEDLGAVQGCLLSTARSYKNSGKIVLFEIWESESEQADFCKDNSCGIFNKATADMLKNNSVVKNMSIPARWWSRTR